MDKYLDSFYHLASITPSEMIKLGLTICLIFNFGTLAMSVTENVECDYSDYKEEIEPIKVKLALEVLKTPFGASKSEITAYAMDILKRWHRYIKHRQEQFKRFCKHMRSEVRKQVESRKYRHTHIMHF